MIILIVAETPRLRIRHLTAADSAFTCRLLNEPSFIENIADRGVRSELDAMHYLAEGPIKSYQQYGYGLFLVEHSESQTPLGFCGLLFREYLQETDIGFAFLPQFWGQGYAFEAASAVMQFGYHKLNLKRIVGLTSAGNTGSVKVLNRLGLQFEKMVQMQPSADYVQLYS
jgi:RimJ/RimL family protein N-acetyltransferase